MLIDKHFEWWSPLVKKAIKANLVNFYVSDCRENEFAVQPHNIKNARWLIAQYPGCRVIESWSSCGWWEYIIHIKDKKYIKMYGSYDRFDLTPPVVNYTFKKWTGEK